MADELARRAADDISLDNAEEITDLLRALRAVGAGGKAAEFARRVADDVSLDNPIAITRLLHELPHTGADDALTRLLVRDPASRVSLDDPSDVARLLINLEPPWLFLNELTSGACSEAAAYFKEAVKTLARRSVESTSTECSATTPVTCLGNCAGWGTAKSSPRWLAASPTNSISTMIPRAFATS